LNSLFSIINYEQITGIFYNATDLTEESLIKDNGVGAEDICKSIIKYVKKIILYKMKPRFLNLSYRVIPVRKFLWPRFNPTHNH